MNRSQLVGKSFVLDTCSLRKLLGRVEDFIESLAENGATTAITSVILFEILGKAKEGYLFPLPEKVNILNLIKFEKLKFFDLPPFKGLIDRILNDLKFPFWKSYIQNNSRDYLIALTALENKALLVTENILDFEVWKTFGLLGFKVYEIEEILYG